MHTQSGYQRHIDGLRALAVLSVVFYHYGQQWFGGGYVGVDVFFVISGYLITNLILGEISSTGKFGFKHFYIRRLRRLFPALAVTLILCLPPAIALFSPIQFRDFGQSLAAATFSVSNILFWQDSGYFHPLAHMRPLLHTWSLAVEEQYYFFWPALLWLATRGAPTWRPITVIIAVGLASFTLNYVWVNGNFDIEYASTIFYLTPFRMFELALGGLAVYFNNWLPKRKLLHEILMAVGLALIGYAVHNFTDSTIIPYLSALLPGIGALLVILSRESSVVGWVLRNRLAVGIGLVSYSLYLVHWPILVFYKHYTYSPVMQPEYQGLFLLSMVSSVAMYRFVEKPFRKLSPTRLNNSGQKLFIYGSIVTISVMGMVGLYIGGSDGITPYNKQALSIDTIAKGKQKRFRSTRKGCNLLRLENEKYCNRRLPSQILVIGNSHEPDGLNIFTQVYSHNKQINFISFGSLNDCDVSLSGDTVISSVSYHQCDIRTETLADKAFINSLTGVIYSANRPFQEHHQSDWEILAYIRRFNPGIPLIVVGGYLNTSYHCTDIYHHFETFVGCKKPELVSYLPFDEQETSGVSLSETLPYLYIDKTRLLCRNNTLKTCKIKTRKEPAFYDSHHLSLSFSQHIGRRIVQTYEQELIEWGFPPLTSTEETPQASSSGQQLKQQGKL